MCREARLFRIIGFTMPDALTSVQAEGEEITEFLRSGSIDFFHIRKPYCDDVYVSSLIGKIPASLHNRLILHSHLHLSHFFNFGGVHLKPGIPTTLPEGMFFTRSFHSLKEVAEADFNNVKYSFLSPIFDSISKEGYRSRFRLDDPDVQSAVEGKAIVALGGVVPTNFKILFDTKFAGAALLGYLWSPKTDLGTKIDELKENRQNLAFP